MSDAVIPIAPVVKSVTVAVPPTRAFELFTRDMGAWWPLATHSVGLERAAGVSFGASVGDPIVETSLDGTRAVWGSIVALEPPHRISFDWHAGRSDDARTLVEVTFTPGSDGGTVVQLVHSGWERWVDGATQSVGYQEGWTPVLQAYVDRAASGM